MARVTHFRTLRLFVNAGIRFPLCHYRVLGYLDMDKSKLPTTANEHEVTCKKCARLLKEARRHAK